MKIDEETLRDEALEFSEAYMDWFTTRHKEFYRGADIYRRDDGTYGLISSGCGKQCNIRIVCENLSSDLFGDITDETTPHELAEMLVETGFMKDMLSDIDEDDE
jgi:hypothetical protein